MFIRKEYQYIAHASQALMHARHLHASDYAMDHIPKFLSIAILVVVPSQPVANYCNTGVLLHTLWPKTSKIYSVGDILASCLLLHLAVDDNAGSMWPCVVFQVLIFSTICAKLMEQQLDALIFNQRSLEVNIKSSKL